jgi:ABC-type amino acid transport substrate-binding protein
MFEVLKKSIASAFIVFLALVGTLARADDGPPDIGTITNQGYIVIAMLGTDNAPFFSVENGQLVGIDVDLAKSIAAAMGVQPRFDRSAKSFDDVIEMVRSGQADIGVSKLSRTAGRAKVVAFSNPYVTLRDALLFNRLTLAEKAQDIDLGDYIRHFHGVLGVIEKSAYETFAKSYFPDAKIISFKNWDSVVDAAINSTVDAAYRDEFAVRSVALNKPETSISLRAITLSDTHSALSVSVPWNKPMLLAIVNQVIDDRPSKMNADDVMNLYRASLAAKGVK